MCKSSFSVQWSWDNWKGEYFPHYYKNIKSYDDNSYFITANNDIDDSILFKIKHNIDNTDKLVIESYINRIIELSPYKDRVPISVLIDDSFFKFTDCIDFRKELLSNIYEILNKPDFLIFEKDRDCFKVLCHILRRLILSDFNALESIDITSLYLLVPIEDLPIITLYEAIYKIKTLTKTPINILSHEDKMKLVILTFILISKKNDMLS